MICETCEYKKGRYCIKYMHEILIGLNVNGNDCIQYRKKGDTMNNIDFRSMQEAITSLLGVKAEIARGAYGMYEAYLKAGFSPEQALELVKLMLISGTNNK